MGLDILRTGRSLDHRRPSAIEYGGMSSRRLFAAVLVSAALPWVAEAAPIASKLSLESPLARLGTGASSVSPEFLCRMIRSGASPEGALSGARLLQTTQLGQVVVTPDGDIRRVDCASNATAQPKPASAERSPSPSVTKEDARSVDSRPRYGARVAVSEVVPSPDGVPSPGSVGRADRTVQVRSPGGTVSLQGSVVGVGASTLMFTPGGGSGATPVVRSRGSFAPARGVVPSIGSRRGGARSFGARTVTPRCSRR